MISQDFLARGAPMSHLIGLFQRVNRTFSACSCNDSVFRRMVVGHGNPRIEATRASHIKANGLLVRFYRNYRERSSVIESS